MNFTTQGDPSVNKAQLVERIATSVSTTKLQVESVLDCAIENIQSAISRGEEVKLVGFGTFDVGSRKARVGRNPQSGAEIRIPARRVPRFRAGKEFKELIAGASKE